MTREEYYKQRSKERFERFCKFLDLHFYVELTNQIILLPSNLLKLQGPYDWWSIKYEIGLIIYNKLHEYVIPPYSSISHTEYKLIPTTFRRVLLRACEKLNKK